MIIKNARIIDSKMDTLQSTILIQPLLDEGEIYVKFNKNAFLDSYGVGSQAYEFYIPVDTTKPKVEVVANEMDMSFQQTFEVTVTFDDPVFPFYWDPIYCSAFSLECLSSTDIEIKGGEIVNFLGEPDFQKFTLEIKPIDQDILISVPANVVVNEAHNGNLKSNLLRLNYEDGILSTDSYDDSYFLIDYRDHNLKIHLFDLNGANMVLYNLHGQSVLEVFLKYGVNEINTNSIINGVYFMRIMTKKGVCAKKVLIK